ncbi:PglL family O-oligosaccharyltransferase [Solimicrobium silvestre]|uniref:O-antigen ligase like membrane protein n=1 Tax=Solimicrobium silvestre TaxID=2099400 RepID=A0A2S9GTF0_9BURK|nr:O-antigen ligase family protein [Solimicrobium silvestre]PRC90999.1 O-antigen ligase like membrane protein [Solimicrobium silvestre]
MLNNKQLNYVIGIFAFFLFCSYIHPFHIHPYRNYYHDALTITALVFGIGFLSFSPKLTIQIPSAVFLPIGMIIIIALQTWNGFLLMPMDSFFPIVELFCFILAIIFGATLVRHLQGMEKLCFAFSCVFVVTSLLSVVFQHIQIAGLNAMPFVMPTNVNGIVSRLYANLAQPNLLALLMCFSLASVWWMYQSSRLNKSMAISIVMIVLWGLTLTQSRIAWIILPLFVLACWFHPRDCKLVDRHVLVFLLFLFALMVVFAPSFLSYVGYHSFETAAQRAGHNERLILWHQAWVMSLMHPWFGVGWLQFGQYQVALSPLFEPVGMSDYAHNFVLNLAAELGWPATLLIVASTVYWFYVSCLKYWRNVHIRYLSLMFCAVAVHSMVEFPLWNAYILIPFGVMVGAAHGSNLGGLQFGCVRSWIISFFVAALLAIGAVSWDYHRVVDGFQALYWEQMGSTKGKGGTDKPEFTLFPQFYDYFRIDKIKIYTGMPAQDITFLEKMSLSFGFPPVLERLALAYALNQRATEALQVMTANQRLNQNYYPKSYALWAKYAEQDPRNFSEIFKRMPKPDSANKPETESTSSKK